MYIKKKMDESSVAECEPRYILKLSYFINCILS